MERIENDDPIKDEHHKNNASNDLIYNNQRIICHKNHIILDIINIMISLIFCD